MSEQNKERLTRYLKDQIRDLDGRLKDNQKQISETESTLKVHQTERERLLTLIHKLEEFAKEQNVDLSEKPVYKLPEGGPEFYSEIGSKGSQRVRRLIQAGKEHEDQ